MYRMLFSRFVGLSRGRSLCWRLFSSLVALAMLLSLLPPAGPEVALALDAPSLVSPNDGVTATIANYPPLGIPEFKWNPVPGATKYQIQISPDISFTDTGQMVSLETTNTSYTPTRDYIAKFADTAPGMSLYWHVRAYKSVPPPDDSWSAWSEIRQFSKQWATPDNRPTLVSPDDGVTLDFFDNPTFSWQPVMGAASYRFQIATDSGFSAVIHSQVTLTTTYQPPTKLGSNTYYWRVVPMDPAGRDGTPSETRVFAMGYSLIPTLLEPADGASLDFIPTFRWTAVRGAQYYKLQYSPAWDFSNTVTEVDTRNTSYTPTAPMRNDTEYYWRVRVYSGNSVTDWSTPRSFSKPWYIQPQPLTPAPNFQHVQHPLFSWTPVPGASQYKIEVSNSATNFPPTTGWTAKTANTFFEKNDFYYGQGQSWFWRVTPLDKTESIEGWPSDPVYFVSDQLSMAPELIYPLYYYVPDSRLNPHEDRTVAIPQFIWQRSVSVADGHEATAYRIEVKSEPLFDEPGDPPLWTMDTENLSAVPTAPLPPAPNGIYYWRVAGLDALGGSVVTPWSQIWKTRVDPSLGLEPTAGTAPKLLRPAFGFDPANVIQPPAYGYESVENVPVLEWWPMQGADSYQVQISADSAFGSTVVDAVTSLPTYSPQPRLGNATYYWRVRGRSGGTGIGSWSEVWRFQVATQSRWREYRALGTLPDGHADATATAYSPAGNTWQPLPNMLTPRSDLGAAVSSQGRLYAIGGIDMLAVPLNVVEEYDPATGQWAGKATMLHPRSGLGVVAAGNGKIYAIGGVDATGVPVAYVDEYTPPGVTPGNGSWASKTAYLPTPRSHFGIAAAGDKIYVIGGISASGVPLATVEAYTLPASGSDQGSWQTLPPMPTPRTGLAAVAVGGKIYAVGGSNYDGYLRTVEEYDPNAGTWTSLADMPTAREALGLAAVGTTVYAIGGLNTGGYLSVVEAYDVGGDSWSGKASLPAPRAGLAAAAGTDVAYAVGGYRDDWLVVADPTHDMTDPDYDLTSLYVAQSKTYWYFGFRFNPAPSEDLRYVLYLDLDHVDNSGATYPPPDPWTAAPQTGAYAVDTVPAHRPEYALYINYNGASVLPGAQGPFDANQVLIYRWSNGSWDAPQTLAYVGGRLLQQPGYVELEVPTTSVNLAGGSAAVSLFSVRKDGGHAQDTVPSDPNVAFATPDSGTQTTTLSRFASISERISLAFPPSNAAGDPATFPSILPFFWHWPVDAMWEGYTIQVGQDPNLTAWIVDATLTASAPFLAHPFHPTNNDLWGDGLYFWRVRPVYYSPIGHPTGAWSQPGRFQRVGLVPEPEGLQTSITFATPTFSWNRVEGAESYDIQIDNDLTFPSASIDLSENTVTNSFTPRRTWPSGTYYWRVRARRNGNVANNWTQPQPFTITLPKPEGLTHYPPGVAGRAPTLCWTPVVVGDQGGSPVFAAWRYKVQVSKDGFASTWDTPSADVEQACWTPTKGYDNVSYQWRVAVIDGDGRLGEWSTPASFTVQYPTTTLVEPVPGAVISGTPTFAWTPVDGAAYYRLQVSQYSSFNPLYADVTTNSTRYTPTTTYAVGKTYYWRVAMVDKDGKIGPWNNATIILDPKPYKAYLPLTLR